MICGNCGATVEGPRGTTVKCHFCGEPVAMAPAEPPPEPVASRRVEIEEDDAPRFDVEERSSGTQMTGVVVGISVAIFAIIFIGAMAEHEHKSKTSKSRKEDHAVVVTPATTTKRYAPTPLPPTFTPIVRIATVTKKHGIAPFSASSCTLRVESHPSRANMCRVWLTCGSRTVYGSNTSYTECESADGGPSPTLLIDDNPTPKDNDPELHADLDQNTMTFADTSRSGVSWDVAFKLSR